MQHVYKPWHNTTYNVWKMVVLAQLFIILLFFWFQGLLNIAKLCRYWLSFWTHRNNKQYNIEELWHLFNSLHDWGCVSRFQFKVVVGNAHVQTMRHLYNPFTWMRLRVENPITYICSWLRTCPCDICTDLYLRLRVKNPKMTKIHKW